MYMVMLIMKFPSSVYVYLLFIFFMLSFLVPLHHRSFIVSLSTYCKMEYHFAGFQNKKRKLLFDLISENNTFSSKNYIHNVETV